MLRSLAVLLLLVGCGGGKAPVTAASNNTLDGQVSAGAKVYEGQCASCHGGKGEGGDKAPALIGPKALDDYKNAKEAFAYIKDNMPPTAPKSLSDDEYWQVTAYLIKQNNLEMTGPLTPASAESVKWSR